MEVAPFFRNIRTFFSPNFEPVKAARRTTLRVTPIAAEAVVVAQPGHGARKSRRGFGVKRSWKVLL